MTIRENGMECDDYIVRFVVNYKDVIILNGNTYLTGAYIGKSDFKLMGSGMHLIVTRLFDMAQMDYSRKPMWIRNQCEEFYQEVMRSIKFCYFPWSCQVVIQELGVGSKCFINQPVSVVQTRRVEPLHQIINYKHKVNGKGEVRLQKVVRNTSSGNGCKINEIEGSKVGSYCLETFLVITTELNILMRLIGSCECCYS
ncbi:hypothetical protein Tco_1052795 [Tanacetum coccineum]